MIPRAGVASRASRADDVTMDEIRHEVEVDTALAALWSERAGVYARIEGYRDSIARMAGFKTQYHGKRRVRDGNEAEWVSTLRDKLALGTIPSYEERNARGRLELLAEAKAEVVKLNERIDALEDEYNAAPWSRFFLVQNHGGHIHSSMHCSTCHPTTRFGWLPTLSGLTEKDAVDEQGTILCSVCFPTAPVEWTVGKPADPDACPAEGIVDGSYKAGWNGNGRAQCKSCGRGVSVTTNGKIRKHKKEA